PTSFFHAPAPHEDPPSFPTRRSSDLATASGHADRPRAGVSHKLPRLEGAGLRNRQRSRSVTTPCNMRRPATRWRRVVDKVHIARDRKSTRLNSSHSQISYAVFCLKKK